MSDKNTFLKEALASLSNLTRLETNTLVGKYAFHESAGVKTTIDAESSEDRMCSQINLVTGDITTAMTDKFVTEYKELRDFHLTRESQGHEIVKKNIETLKEILGALDFFEKESEKTGK
jgi:Asp-tRNA(Asn)/Glu-tRNA(Gln) amidotransferase B subunit